MKKLLTLLFTVVIAFSPAMPVFGEAARPQDTTKTEKTKKVKATKEKTKKAAKKTKEAPATEKAPTQ